MTGLTVDGDVLRQARLTSGCSRAELSRVVGISGRTLSRIEDNVYRTTRELSLDRIARMAAAVSVDPLQLLGRGPSPTGLVEQETQDVGRLLAALAATRQPLRPADVVAVFGWSRDRLEQTVSRANSDLHAKSLLVVEGARGLKLQPANTTGHDDAAKIIAAVATTEGLDSSYMKVLHRFWSGKVSYANPSRKYHAATALLARLGLLETVDGTERYRPSQALNFAFPHTGTSVEGATQ